MEFTQSYGASGDQSRAVESGLPADIVALSLAPDVDKLVEPGIVAADWAKTAKNDGFVTNSVVVFAVRKGNPKNIKTWDDLIKDGVEVDTPNPFTSGGAKWNLMAAYGAQLEQGKSPDEALAYLKALLEHTPVQDKSARESLATFAGGKGDVLLAYENEALTAQKADVELDYVIPDETILIQNPAAVTEDSKSPEKAKAFLDYLATPEAQKIYAANGYRSVLPDLVDDDQVPDAEDAVQDRQVRRLGQGQRRVLRSRQGLGGEDRVRPRGLHCQVTRGSSPSPMGCRPSRPAPPGSARGRPARRRRPAGARRLRSGPLVVGGVSVAWLTLIVLIPLAAVVVRSFEGGAAEFWDAITNRQAISALRLTLGLSLVVAAIDAVMGTLIAWVLVRDEFRGKALVNALIDLPFALPTIVAGLTLLALYGSKSPVGINVAYTRVGIGLALLFVTLPFVVRAVQPVLMSLDREAEQAAASLGAGPIYTFRRIILPALRPAILAGVALAFGRAVGEFGAVVLISGNIPFKTEVAAVFVFSRIESDATTSAAAVSVVLLVISFVLLLGISYLARRGER